MERWPKDVAITAGMAFACIIISFIGKTLAWDIKTPIGLTILLLAVIAIQLGMMPFIKFKHKDILYFVGIGIVSFVLGSTCLLQPNYMALAGLIALGAFVLAGYSIKMYNPPWEKKYTMGMVAFIAVALLYVPL